MKAALSAAFPPQAVQPMTSYFIGQSLSSQAESAPVIRLKEMQVLITA
jgi:hypothetical protein